MVNERNESNRMKAIQAPLLEALVKHSKAKRAGFHVPGHQYGQALLTMHTQQRSRPWESAQDAAHFYSSIMKLDVTELTSTDDLHHPEASILEAQRQAAQCFGADETFFLVGGSTSGNIAVLLAVCNPEDIVIVQRNVHKSIINGLKMAGARAVFVAPQIEPQTGLATVPSIIYVQEALRRYPQARGIVLSTPNYYGIAAPMEPYAKLAHQYGIPLIVDEAHGAHYGHHQDLPKSAVVAGADAVIQSAHKTLPALTMGAMLHIQGNYIDRQQLRSTLAMLQSSSPSFPIMASLDISRAMIDAYGPALFEQGLDQAQEVRQWIKAGSGSIRAVDRIDRAYSYDPLRIVLYDQSGRMTGLELQQRLQELGCWIEMADARYAVLLAGIGTSKEDITRLKEAIALIEKEIESQSEGRQWVVCTADAAGCNSRNELQLTEHLISEPVVFSRRMGMNRQSKRIRLMDAEGLLSAEMVIPYPPGIPVLYEGERISQELITHCQLLSRAGAKFQGAEDEQMETIAVFYE